MTTEYSLAVSRSRRSVSWDFATVPSGWIAEVSGVLSCRPRILFGFWLFTFSLIASARSRWPIVNGQDALDHHVRACPARLRVALSQNGNRAGSDLILSDLYLRYFNR